MLDVGWPELLVIAIVLIVVVGPKDLPPMLRAFGRTTKKLRGMANEFRGQFDEVLREAELDDVKKTLTEARKLNPMQTIRDAVNPLKDTGKQIKSDLEKAVNENPTKVTDSEIEAPAVPKVEIPESSMKLADGPPTMPATATAAKPAAAKKAPAKSTAGKAPATKAPAAKTAAAAKSATKPAAAKPAAKSTAAAKPDASAKPAAKATSSKASKSTKDKA